MGGRQEAGGRGAGRQPGTSPGGQPRGSLYTKLKSQDLGQFGGEGQNVKGDVGDGTESREEGPHLLSIQTPPGRAPAGYLTIAS